MNSLLIEQEGAVLTLTLNRIAKHNAFDEHLIAKLHAALLEAEQNNDVHVIILKGHGAHFSSGADLDWMQRTAHMSMDENIADALLFAQMMYTLKHHSKTTIAMVHGQTIGGGVGLVAACDLAFAADSAQFCCPEVVLGLLPAVISPYVVQAIGARAARWLFLSATRIHAQRAYELQLIHACLPEHELLAYTMQQAQRMAQHAPCAMQQTKKLVEKVQTCEITLEIQRMTAELIAKARMSEEGQHGVNTFLQKKHHV